MPNRCVVYTFSICAYFDVTSGNNLDSKKVNEDEMFEQQDISKDYEYVKSPSMRHFNHQSSCLSTTTEVHYTVIQFIHVIQFMCSEAKLVGQSPTNSLGSSIDQLPVFPIIKGLPSYHNT